MLSLTRIPRSNGAVGRVRSVFTKHGSSVRTSSMQRNARRSHWSVASRSVRGNVGLIGCQNDFVGIRRTEQASVRLFSSDDSKATISVVEDGHRVSCHMRIFDPQTQKTIIDTVNKPTVDPKELGDKPPPPISFVVGQGQVLPGLEKRVLGMKVGEEWTDLLGPEEAFGKHDLNKIVQISLRKHPKTGQVAETIPQPGTMVQLSDGTMGKVMSASEEAVMVDTNHEYAGKTLEFHIRLEEIEEVDQTPWSGVHVQKMDDGDNKTYPQTGDNIKVHYVGYLADNGQVFDRSAADRPINFVLGVGRVIKGWDEGLKKVSLGEKARLFISSDFAYGANGAPPVIPANANLIFDVELVEINGQRSA